ncbi:bifunctional phosphoribosylaminoimidazolecarboxamide formyltransferase/IMP cyclohydrolase [Paracoccaceae bacterium]|nr:bifunctional phosphoribosylaminoimidazolecarboxamide formyltransferase/IMP cyclohydrolase [Paracoccaceae bacterium]
MKSGILPIRRALISVSEKNNLKDLAIFLDSLGVDIVSTGGTANYLKKEGLQVKEVSDLTGFPEILNGRVKTLHPKVHAPILFDRDDAVSAKELEEMGSKAIDLVVVNLYPFETTLKRKALRKDIIENIDIGGVALMRAAAKNFEHVMVISDPGDYIELKKELTTFKGCTRHKTRKFFAGKAFSQTSHYDHLITQWFLSKKQLGSINSRVFGGTSKKALRYGENPHQRAIYLNHPDKGGKKKQLVNILQGTLSYNNLIDATAAYKILCELEGYKKTSCVIIKHGNPCGVTIDNNVSAAYKKAFETDPVSAFGGIVAINKKIDEKLAKKISSIFTEVIIAESFSPEAHKILSLKKNIKIVEIKSFDGALLDEEEIRSVIGGYLVQETSISKANDEELEVVTRRKPTKEELNNLVFLWKIVKHVKSNAIVVGSNFCVTGIGAGQTNRVGSVKLAINNSKKVEKKYKDKLKVASNGMASDAFFPFPDSIKMASRNGISCIIQPGGSINDSDVVSAADKLNIAMVFTKRRLFSH